MRQRIVSLQTMETTNPISETGVSTQLPNINNNIVDFNNRLTDYHYTVTAKGLNEKTEEILISRGNLTRIRAIVKEIAIKGYHEPIANEPINRRFNFLNINLKNAGIKDVELEDVDVYLYDKETKSRFVFNMKDVSKVRCMSETSTGVRTNNTRRKNERRKNEEVIKQTRRKFNTSEERAAAIKESRRKWANENKDKIREYRKKWCSKNKEKLRAYRKKVESNMSPEKLEEQKEKRREYARNYAKRNREKRLEYIKKWRLNNPERVKANARAAYIKSRERC